MAKPTGTPKYAQESVVERAGYWVGDKLDKLSRADVALGPAEAAFTYLAFAIAGLLLGLLPVVIFRQVWLLLISPLAGVIGGLLLAIPVRGIRTRGGRFGIIGATILAVLFSCGSCTAVQGIAFLQKMRQAQQLRENALKMGLPVPKAVPGIKGMLNLHMGKDWWLLPLLVGIVGAVCLSTIIIIVILNRRAQQGP